MTFKGVEPLCKGAVSPDGTVGVKFGGAGYSLRRGMFAGQV